VALFGKGLAILADVRYQQLERLLTSRRRPTLIRRLNDHAAQFTW